MRAMSFVKKLIALSVAGIFTMAGLSLDTLAESPSLAPDTGVGYIVDRQMDRCG